MNKVADLRFVGINYGSFERVVTVVLDLASAVATLVVEEL